MSESNKNIIEDLILSQKELKQEQAQVYEKIQKLNNALIIMEKFLSEMQECIRMGILDKKYSENFSEIQTKLYNRHHELFAYSELLVKKIYRIGRRRYKKKKSSF